MENLEEIINIFKKYGFSISKTQAEKFLSHYLFLIEENEKYNLTAITDFDEVLKKHFIDCALAVEFFKGNVLDVGSGAGFPGVVLAILNNNLNLTLIDSLEKRVKFLNSLSEKLQLNNVKALHCRIEDFKEKEKFDCVTARAVAPLQTLAEYLLPFVKVGGVAVIYKGADAINELNGAEKAIKTLGGQLECFQKYNLEDMTRSVIVLRKIAHSPSVYPRGQNKPRKNPL